MHRGHFLPNVKHRIVSPKRLRGTSIRILSSGHIHLILATYNQTVFAEKIYCWSLEFVQEKKPKNGQIFTLEYVEYNSLDLWDQFEVQLSKPKRSFNLNKLEVPPWVLHLPKSKFGFSGVFHSMNKLSVDSSINISTFHLSIFEKTKKNKHIF